MRRWVVVSCLMMFLINSGVISAPPLTGLEIMTNVNQVDHGTDIKSNLTMHILGDQERVRKITSFRHEVPGEVTKTILLLTFLHSLANLTDFSPKT